MQNDTVKGMKAVTALWGLATYSESFGDTTTELLINYNDGLNPKIMI
jgi:hypothetical protein